MRKILYLLFILTAVPPPFCVGDGQAQDRVQFPTVPEKKAGPVMVKPDVPHMELPGFPAYQPRQQWMMVPGFNGGVNQFFPTGKLGPNEALTTTNLLPLGVNWLKKRDGYAKIYFTEKGSIHGLAIGDSSNAKSRLVVVGDDDLYFTDSSYAWELQDFGNTTAEATYFTGTPFGLVISNDGSDSTRLWDGVATTTIKPLGNCDTGTVSHDYSYDNAVLADTFYFVDSGAVWTADEWIGYFLYFTSVDSLWEIVDNNVNTIEAVNPSCPDTNRAGWTFEIISQPDSAASDLIYPKGQATAYYQDRLFVSSKWYPWRIYYSQCRLINCIDPDAFINLDMDAHDKIVAMRVFNNHLIVFGEHSIYGIDENVNRAYPVTKSIGCIAPKTVAVGDDYIYFLSHLGVYRFNGNIYGSMSYKLEKISDPIFGSLSEMDAGNIDICGGAYTDKQYWFSYHAESTWVFDERTKAWYGPQTFGFTDALILPVEMVQAWDEELVPDGDVTTQWTLQTGSDHYDAVNDGESATNYVHSSTDDQIERFTLSNTGRFKTGSTVGRLRVNVYGKRTWKPELEVYYYYPGNTTDYLLHTFYWTDFSTDYTTASFVSATSPITSASWHKGAIDSLNLTFKYIEGSDAEHFYMGGIWVEVEYSSPMDAGSFLFAQPSEHFVYKYGDALTDDTSATSGEVYGSVVTASYQSGWFGGESPVDQYQMREFWLDKKTDTGSTYVYLYKNYGTTAICTLTAKMSQDTTELFYLPPKVSGHNFSVKIETASNIDTLEIKGWGALIRTLGQRKD